MQGRLDVVQRRAPVGESGLVLGQLSAQLSADLRSQAEGGCKTTI